jgi:hypothetical protein
MQDLHFRGATLRMLWRGFHCPQRPYCYFRWGAWIFGGGPVGFMYWPRPKTPALVPVPVRSRRAA